MNTFNNKLVRLCEIGFAESTKQKALIDKESTGTILGPEVKELLQSNASNSTTLIQEEVYKTISEGAEPFKCMREVLPIIRTDSYSVRVVKGETGSYADDLAEGAKIPIDTQTYTKQDITIKKIGTRPLITNELIEDGLWDIVALELKKAGARVENKLNRDCIAELLLAATGDITDVDPAGDHLAVTDLAKARADVEGQNYIPDTLILHPSAEGYLLQDSNLVYASWAGTANTLHTGKLPKLMGMKPYTLSVTTGNTTDYWDSTDSAAHYSGIVMDSSAAAYLAMRRDLTVEQYDDPIHDIVGIATTMRYGVEVIQNKSKVLILTK